MQASIEMCLCCHEFSHLHNQTYRRLEGWSWLGDFFFILSFTYFSIDLYSKPLLWQIVNNILSGYCQRQEDDPDWSLPQQSSISLLLLLLPCNLTTSFLHSSPYILLLFPILLNFPPILHLITLQSMRTPSSLALLGSHLSPTFNTPLEPFFVDLY